MDNELKQYLLTKIYEHALKEEPAFSQQYMRKGQGFDYQITIKTDERLYIFKSDSIDELITKEDPDIEAIVAEDSKNLEKIIEIDKLIKRADRAKKKSKDD